MENNLEVTAAGPEGVQTCAIRNFRSEELKICRNRAHMLQEARARKILSPLFAYIKSPKKIAKRKEKKRKKEKRKRDPHLAWLGSEQRCIR